MIPTAAIVDGIHVVAPTLPSERANDIANTIAAVATTPEDAALLVETSFSESTFRVAVERCDVTGDHGRSISSYQLQRYWLRGHSRAEVCASPVLATTLALEALSHGKTVRLRIASFMGRNPKDGEVNKRVHFYAFILKAIRERWEA